MKHGELKKGVDYAVSFNPNSRFRHIQRFRLLDSEKTATYGVAPGWGRDSRRYHESPAYPAQRLDEKTGRKIGDPASLLAKHIIEPWADYKRARDESEQQQIAIEREHARELKAAKRAAREIRRDYGLKTTEIEVEQRYGTTRIIIDPEDMAKFERMVSA